jgi:hypothetical protein
MLTKVAGAPDFFRIESNRAIVEGGERRLDFGEPLIDLVGDLIGLRIGFLQAIHLRLQGVARSLLFFGEWDLLPTKLPQTIGVAVSEVGRDLDPFPTFGADLLGSIVELFCDQPVEQPHILQPAAVVALE